MEVLLADDDRAARAAFRTLLESEGYRVRLARNGEEAVAAFQAARPDLVLLDVMMPKKNGLAACGEIRALDAQVPVVFFTAMPSDVSLVRGLGLGGDDYIAKDRSPEEFLARIRAALRRSAASRAATAGGMTVCLADATVDFRQMCVTVGEERMALTRSEVQFLRLLLSDAGRVFSNDEIFAALHGEGYIGDDAAIRALVRRLKHKLGRAGNRLVNERALGYRLVV